MQQHPDDVLGDELRDPPQEEAVRHRTAVLLPRPVEGRHADGAAGRDLLEVVPEQIALGLGPRPAGARRDVVRHVDAPVPVLHELPVDQRRATFAVEERVADVHVTVDDGPPRTRLVGAECVERVDELLRISHVVGYTDARRTVEVVADLLDPAHLRRLADPGLEPRRLATLGISHPYACKWASSARRSAVCSTVHGVKASRNTPPASITSSVMTTPCCVTGSTPAHTPLSVRTPVSSARTG